MGETIGEIGCAVDWIDQPEEFFRGRLVTLFAPKAEIRIEPLQLLAEQRLTGQISFGD